MIYRFFSFLYTYAFPIYRKLYFTYKFWKDRHYLKLLRSLIRPGFQIADVGANIGFYSKFFSAETGKQGRVYCFEPDRTNFRHLQEEMKGAGNATLFQKAAAAGSGSIQLYASPLLNVDHRTYETKGYAAKHTVEKTAIDTCLSGGGKLDLVKLDVQGFEMEALKGMKQSLLTNREILVFAELWEHGLKEAGSSALAVWHFLHDLGFLIYTVGSGNLTLLTMDDASRLDQQFFQDIHIIASRNALTPYLSENAEPKREGAIAT